VGRARWGNGSAATADRGSGLHAARLQSGPTIASYFSSFAPGVPWDDLCAWPPDVFAVANVVLDQTEAYRFAVAPPRGGHWPFEPDWNERVVAAGREWRDAVAGARCVPACVRRSWDTLTAHLGTPLRSLRAGEPLEVIDALLTLHAVADEACRNIASPEPGDVGSLERRAWSLLEQHGSSARISPQRIRITPKTHFAGKGITIRSFSRYLALNYESVEVGWRRLAPPARWSEHDLRDFNVVLLPWPLRVDATAFRPVAGPLDNMSPGFGFFEFCPRTPVDLELVARLVREAQQSVGRVHGVILPEDAIAADELALVENTIGDLGVGCLLAGVRAPADAGGMGHNFVHFGARSRDGWVHYQEAKHHRWCLDESQIRQYHLSRVLDPGRLWWEAIGLPVRTAQVIDVGGGATIAPLICEDLARLDEVADVLRRVGPSLVIALLLDGPQLPQRWSAQYAGVLADEPGSAVLTLTSFGMVSRSRPPGHGQSRAVAMWSEPGRARRQLDLGAGAKGLLVTLSLRSKTVWTADGRCHENNTPAVTLRRVEQLHGRTKKEG
jgi:hypothetical protein